MNILILPLSALALLSCSCAARKIGEYETVMPAGMKIIVTNSSGTMEIKEAGGFQREYAWPSGTKTFRLFGREKRWCGSRGAYRPYGDGTLHAVLEEGQQHFDTIEGAVAWLAWQCRWNQLKWTSDGLVVGWKEQRRESDGFIALTVDVWQLYILGRKPFNLPGASNGSLLVTGGQSVAHSPLQLPLARVVAGRRFTGRALGLMEDDGITADDVLSVLHRAPAERMGDFRYYSGRELDPIIGCYVCTNAAGDVLSASR